jgi:hypothetical protein
MAKIVILEKKSVPGQEKEKHVIKHCFQTVFLGLAISPTILNLRRQIKIRQGFVYNLK